MLIANVMMGGKKGGLEQALLDTSEALRAQGHNVTAFIRYGAAIYPALAQAKIPTVSLRAPYGWNIGGRARLRQMLRLHDLIILHGNRAAQLTRAKDLPPVLAIVHSRFFKPAPHITAIAALSPARAKELHTPFVVPNLVRIPEIAPRAPFHNPPIIGAMGRLSEEKGMDLLIDALALLQQRGVAFRAVIGGEGGMRAALEKRIAQHGLGGHVLCPGWVEDKKTFFQEIDLFVLPSRTENFPITLLEAMAHGCPCVATRCGGPQTMLADGVNGLLADINAAAIAEAVARAFANESASRAMGEAARNEAKAHYAMDVVGAQLSAIAAQVASLR